MATRQTRRQLQFTSFEMAMIATSFVVTVTAVFFLGLFVGKRNASYHSPADDRVARVPVDDFTKYKRPAPIEKAPRETHAAPSEPAPAAAANPGEAAKPSGDAAKSGASPIGTAAAVSPAAATSAAAAGAAVAALPAQPTTADAARLATATGTATATAEAAAKEAAKAKEVAAAKAKAKEKEQAEASTGRGYTVQLLATRKQADADSLAQKLKSRGYAAYIKQVSDGAGAWYRVRVGSYGAFGEARAMADKCRRDLGLGQAFVSTE